MKYLLLYNAETGAIVGHAIIPDTEDAPRAPGGFSYAEVDAADWEYAERFNTDPLDLPCLGPQLVLSGEKQRIDQSRTPINTADLIQAHGLYRANRRDAYDPIPDQLDRVTATLEKLAADGVDIGEAGREQVQSWRGVKTKFPKGSPPTL